MKRHTKVWLAGKGLTGHEGWIPCEICKNKQVVDIHHIEPRGQGGSKLRDHYDNLLGLCRDCHMACESGAISKEFQRKIKEIV